MTFYHNYVCATFNLQLSQKDEHINELKETVYDAKSNAEYYRNNMYQVTCYDLSSF